MTHSLPIRIYYEDTDAGGIVYYANYLKFIERGRSEWVRACGVDQLKLRAERGMIIVVRKVEADYLRSAVFDDIVEATTELLELGGARLELMQTVRRGDEVLFTARVTLVCVGPDGRAARLPDDIRAALSAPAA